MQSGMADNRPWMPYHSSDQLKPSYAMMTSQLVQRSSELGLTRNSSNFHGSRGIHWQDQFVDHCSMWRPWLSSNHSALVQPHGLLEKKGQLVHGSYFAGAGTAAYSGGASQEAGHVNGFCKREISSSTGSQIPQCKAENCNANLSSVKQYYRRHKVCELHSKASTVIVCGLIQRFCQQCSRFHLRSEFDERKRSCRKCLAEHNRRRRKPQANASACEAGRSALEDGNHKTKGSSGHEATGPATVDIENSQSLISMKNSHSNPRVIETSKSSLDLQIYSSCKNVPVG